MDTIYIERQEINSNGSNRYFQNKTCVISSVYGPTASHLSKANLRKKIILGAHFEVILKSNKKLTTTKEKALEFQLRTFLENMIDLEEYPNSILKVFCIVEIDDGSLFSALVNSSLMALMLNGLKMKKTCFCFEYDFEKDILFPTKDEQNTKNTLKLSLNLHNSHVDQLLMDSEINPKKLDQVINKLQNLIPQTIGLLKAF